MLEEFLKKNLKNIEVVRKILIEHKGSVIGLVVHKNADPDAIASALAFSSFFNDLKTINYIFVPEGINAITKNVLSLLKIKYEFHNMEFLRNIHNHIELFIILDTANSSQLGETYKYIRSKPFILIDHHVTGDLVKKAKAYYVDKLVSTSELTYILLRDIWILPQDIATLLLTGILYDSKKFTYFDPLVFAITSELINVWNANYFLAINLLKKKIELPERIAKLKALKRMTIYRVGEIPIVFTNIGSYESSIANTILELGAHLVFVISSKRKNKVRIIGRASQYFINKTGLSLTKNILCELAEKLRGSGGGHDTAGVVEYYGVPEEGIKTLLNILEKKLGKLTVLKT